MALQEESVILENEKEVRYVKVRRTKTKIKRGCCRLAAEREEKDEPERDEPSVVSQKSTGDRQFLET